MEIEKTIEALKAIAAKQERLTDEEKALIETTCAELKIEFKPTRKSCKSCYQDAALQCYNAISKKLPQETDESSECDYVLRDGVDVYFGSIRVNSATITDELAEYIIKRGFEKKFFKKCK